MCTLLAGRPWTLATIAWALSAAAGTSCAGSSNLGSALFDGGLAIAIAPQDQGRLTGYLAVPGTSCRMYLHGKPQGEGFRLAVLTPGDDHFVGYGELTVSHEGDTPVVRLDVPIPASCQAVPDLPRRLFRLQGKREWTGIRLVQGKRAHLHDEAHESTRRKAYVVKWDAVAIDRETPAFARALYLGGKTTVTGWLQQDDIFGPDPTPEMEYVRSQLPPMQGQWPQGRMPVAVRAYLNSRERCEHFEGEEGTDAARRKFLDRARDRECGDARRRHAELTAAHAANAAQARFLEANAPPP